jgi:proton-translocating NAD(P)+ transhydrogenase subunit alpha
MLQTLVILLVIFVLAMYVGFVIIQRVPPILHTPLMSGSNAISGITIVGSIVVACTRRGWRRCSARSRLPSP